MERNIVWNRALTRNKELAGDKIATIDNKIMNINNYLDYFLTVTHMQKMTAFIFGDVAKQLKEKRWQCWPDLLVGDTENREYLNFLSRGGLQIPS